MRQHIISTIAVVLLLLAGVLTTPLQAKTLKGYVLIDGQRVDAEYTQLVGNTVRVGTGQNACIPHYTSGFLTIPSEVEINGTTYRVTEIGRMAFRLCDGLTGVDIKEGVTRIGEFAFVGCSLGSITLPASMRSLGSGAFIDCLTDGSCITCLGETPPRWEYNDVFLFHKDGIGSMPMVISSGIELYVPDTAKDTYLNEAYSDTSIGWNHAEGWNMFASQREGQAYYYVYTPEDLNLLRDIVNHDTYGIVKAIVLENDIDMEGYEWDGGIGRSETEPCYARVDGQGHTISNLTIKSRNGYGGIFEHFAGRYIDNLRLYHVTVENANLNAGALLGETAYCNLTNVWQEDCLLGGIVPMPASMIGRCLTSGGAILNSCVLYSTNPSGSKYSGGMIGVCTGATIKNCASIIMNEYIMPTFPFVRECRENGDVFINNSYAFAYNMAPTPDFVHMERTVLAGMKQSVTLADGTPSEITFDLDRMKSLFMLPVLGLNGWCFAEGYFPLPVAFADKIPVEVNKPLYCLREQVPSRINVLEPFSPWLFNDLSAGGYTSSLFRAHQLWINDKLDTSAPAPDKHSPSLPIGTATIDCEEGVIYDRTLQAEFCGTEAVTVPVIEEDKDGEPLLDDDGNIVPSGEEYPLYEQPVHASEGYSVCLPYDLTPGGSTRVFYPEQVTPKGDRLFVQMNENEDGQIKAWQPSLVTVEQDKVPLSVNHSVTIRPRTSKDDIVLNGGAYTMIGTTKVTATGATPVVYELGDDDLWTATTKPLPAFHAYFTAADDKQDNVFTTGMGFRAEERMDTLFFCKGQPVTDPDFKWWPLNTSDKEIPQWLGARPDLRRFKHARFDATFALARPKTCYAWFEYFTELEDIKGLEYLNTSEATSLENMFYKCAKIKQLDLYSFDIPKVQTIEYMFADCEALERIIVGDGWQTDNISDGHAAFYNCRSIVGQYGKKYRIQDISWEYAFAGPDGYLWRRYPYYVAKLAEGGNTLLFAGSDTPADGTNSFIVMNDVTTVQRGWFPFKDKFNKVKFDKSFQLAEPVSCSGWFNDMSYLTSIEGMENLNTSKVKTMNSMFLDCKLLTDIDLSHFDTRQVTDMGRMFKGCERLKSIDVSSFNTTRVENMSEMFMFCFALTSLDVSSFKTFNVTDFSYMFYDLENVKKLDLNNFNVSKATNTRWMFHSTFLKTILCNNDWNLSADISENMFLGCLYLEGAVNYREKQVDGTMANPTTGYFTAYPTVELKDGEDNSAVLARYEGQKVNVNYDRVIRAQDNGDGTWTSKAATICLPYDLDLTREKVLGRFNIYRLYMVYNPTANETRQGKKYEFLFSDVSPKLQAGHGYVIVINEGELALNARAVVIHSEEQPEDVYFTNEEGHAGQWRGSLRNRSNEECTADLVYTMSNDGDFRRISNTTERERGAWMSAFRAAFFADEFKGRNRYYSVYRKWVNGEDDEEENPTINLPANLFEGDSDFSGYTDDDSETAIREITGDKGSDSEWYDLLGRKLSGQPSQKGIYINNGKKVKK